MINTPDGKRLAGYRTGDVVSPFYILSGSLESGCESLQYVYSEILASHSTWDPLAIN